MTFVLYAVGIAVGYLLLSFVGVVARWNRNEDYNDLLYRIHKRERWLHQRGVFQLWEHDHHDLKPPIFKLSLRERDL